MEISHTQLVAAVVGSEVLDHANHFIPTASQLLWISHHSDEWVLEDRSGATHDNCLLKITRPFHSRARITTQTSWLFWFFFHLNTSLWD